MMYRHRSERHWDSHLAIHLVLDYIHKILDLMTKMNRRPLDIILAEEMVNRLLNIILVMEMFRRLLVKIYVITAISRVLDIILTEEMLQ